MSQNSPTLLPSRETEVPVPHVSLYKQYTTEDALETAADSYGGLTDRDFLSLR